MAWLGTQASVLVLAASPAGAAQIRGTLQLPPERLDPASVGALPTQTLIQVARPAPAYRSRVPDAALFLEVESSLPLPPPDRAARVTVRGFQLMPSVVSCAVDGSIEVVNESTRGFDLSVGGTPVGRLEPDGRLEWTCVTGPEGAGLEPIGVGSFPFMQAKVYVGEVGVAAFPDAEGQFRISAPEGKYRLLVVTSSGVVGQLPVEVGNADVDLGVVTVEEPAR